MIRMNQRFRSSKIQRKEFFFRVKEELGEWHEKRVKFLVCQDVEDEIEAGSRLLDYVLEVASGKRQSRKTTQ